MARRERTARSWRAPDLALAHLRQGLDPDRKSDRGNRRAGAKLGHQPVIAPASYQWFDAIALGMQLKLESRVGIEAAPERSGKARQSGIDAARGHEADAAFELVDRSRNVEFC